MGDSPSEMLKGEGGRTRRPDLPEHILHCILDCIPHVLCVSDAERVVKLLTALRMTSKAMRLAVWTAKHLHGACSGRKSVFLNITSEDPVGEGPMQRTEKLTCVIRNKRTLEHLMKLVASRRTTAWAALS